MEEEQREDFEISGKSNIVILTVIAILTLIVVVIGATFAYLASYKETQNMANINLTTNGGGEVLIVSNGSDINIEANLQNFYKGSGNLTDDIKSSILYQTAVPNTLNYNISINVDYNDFEYTAGKCVDKTTNDVITLGEITNSKQGCLARNNAKWIAEEKSEIALDLYEEKDSCQIDGICVDKLRNKQNYTSENACISADASNVWIKSITENDKCYEPVASADLTNTKANDKITLLLNKEITTTSSLETTKNYKTTITLINYDHNQIMNGTKSFSGNVLLEPVD